MPTGYHRERIKGILFILQPKSHKNLKHQDEYSGYEMAVPFINFIFNRIVVIQLCSIVK